MKPTINTLAIFLLFHASVSKAQEFGDFSNGAINLQPGAYHLRLTNSPQGFLETTKMKIGTIDRSHHFNDEGYNESHNGIYLGVANWAVGTYKNSGYPQSTVITYNSQLYQHKSLKVNLVTGVADGYKRWNLARGDYLPVFGVSAQWMYLKTMMSYDVLAFGVKLPLNQGLSIPVRMAPG
jgi:hypothetical protein